MERILWGGVIIIIMKTHLFIFIFILNEEGGTVVREVQREKQIKMGFVAEKRKILNLKGYVIFFVVW